MSMEKNDFYEFGKFRMDVRRRLLLRADEPLSLTPKAFDTLLVLVQNRNRVLEKDELMTAIWGDTIVEESGLARNISVLRKLLGESKDEHQFIVTVPGRGYQFVAAVRAGNGEEVTELVLQESKVSVVVEEEENEERGTRNAELTAAPTRMPQRNDLACLSPSLLRCSSWRWQRATGGAIPRSAFLDSIPRHLAVSIPPTR